MAEPCPVVAQGKAYPSIRKAAEAIGISERWAYRNLQIKGHLEEAGRARFGNRNAKRTPVTIYGLRFESLSEAGRALGMNRNSVRRALSANSSRADRERLYAACIRIRQSGAA